MIRGEVIRKYRRLKGLDIEQLARLTRLPLTYLIELEEGVREATPGALGKLLEHLDIPEEDYESWMNICVGGLGNKVRALREKENYTLQSLSMLTDLSVTYLSEIERGERLPPFTTMRKIARIFKVPVSIFISSERKNLFVGEKLKNVRTAKGLTQEQLAKYAGISPGLIAQLESGKVNPSIKTLEKLCRILGVSLCYLTLEREEIDEIVTAVPDNIRELLYNHKIQILLGSICFMNNEQLSMVLNFIDMVRQNSNIKDFLADSKIPLP